MPRKQLIILHNSILNNSTYYFKSQLCCYFSQKKKKMSIRSKLYVPWRRFYSTWTFSCPAFLAMLSFLCICLFATLDSELHRGRNSVWFIPHQILTSQHETCCPAGTMKCWKPLVTPLSSRPVSFLLWITKASIQISLRTMSRTGKAWGCRAFC